MIPTHRVNALIMRPGPGSLTFAVGKLRIQLDGLAEGLHRFGVALEPNISISEIQPGIRIFRLTFSPLQAPVEKLLPILSLEQDFGLRLPAGRVFICRYDLCLKSAPCRRKNQKQKPNNDNSKSR